MNPNICIRKSPPNFASLKYKKLETIFQKNLDLVRKTGIKHQNLVPSCDIDQI